MPHGQACPTPSLFIDTSSTELVQLDINSISPMSIVIQEHERGVIDQFRTVLLNEGIVSPGDTIGIDDVTLLRFLRARKLNIQDAKKMVVNCQHWRKTVEGVGMDVLYDSIDPLDYPERELVTQYWPLYFHKTDKEGRPINIQAFGKLDVASLLKKVDGDRQWKAFLTNCDLPIREIFPACSRVKGAPIASSFCIVDLKGFNLQKFWSAKSHLRAAFQIAQDYYPEMMAKLVIINAPSSFTVIWAAVKPWLAAETVAKVVILGADYKDFLLQFIEPQNLPSNFGGTCTCESLGGCALAGDGPWLDGRIYTGQGPSKYKPKLEQESGELQVRNVKEEHSIPADPATIQVEG